MPVFDVLLPAVTNAPEETLELGRRMAADLEPGTVAAFYGDLGAGKTHLIKGICSGMGVPEHEVTSPTFTLIQEYRSGRLPLFHFDAYRIKNEDEFFELGYDEYFYGEGICLIEWPERVASLLPPHALKIRLVHQGPSTRLIEKIGD